MAKETATMKTTEQILKEYREACLEISEQCVAEGYPSHGSNYELRCEQLMTLLS